jgi:hypothetical protein
MVRTSEDSSSNGYVMLLGRGRAVRVPNGIFGQTKEYPGRRQAAAEQCAEDRGRNARRAALLGPDRVHAFLLCVSRLPLTLDFNGRSGGTRTPNPRFWRPVL